MLLLIMQIATIAAFLICQTQDRIWLVCVASIVMGAIVAFGLARWTTTSLVIFLRRSLATFFLFSVFVFCFSAIVGMKLSDKAFHESGEWSPMPPEALSGPLAMLAAAIGFLAAVGMHWVNHTVESPDPERADR